MKPFTSPFAVSTAPSGHGEIGLDLLPPGIAVLRNLSYQYPLKLIAPAAVELSGTRARTLIHTVFLLTYGGGLVAGDTIHLDVRLVALTRLVLLTQGSTKIFKSPSHAVVSRQCMQVRLGPDSALCYLPDPVQPFAESAFEQKQIYELDNWDANLCVLDWVCEGRAARGESWKCRNYTSRNEIWTSSGLSRRLLLRDNLHLDGTGDRSTDVRIKMHGVGAFGTLILGGQLFRALGEYFLHEFKDLPRIGAKEWETADSSIPRSTRDVARAARVEQEARDGVLWSAAVTRGFVVIKFGAREAEGGKTWLRQILMSEGTVENEFGERALLCMK